jgi:hypothetical protein
VTNTFTADLEKAVDAVQQVNTMATTPKQKKEARAALKQASAGIIGPKQALWIFVVGFVVVLLAFVTVAGVVLVLALNDHNIPDSLTTLATALISGIVGGLFGLSRQQTVDEE